MKLSFEAKLAACWLTPGKAFLIKVEALNLAASSYLELVMNLLVSIFRLTKERIDY